MSLFENGVINSTLSEALYLQIEETLTFAQHFLESCLTSLPLDNFSKSITDINELVYYENFLQVFHFNDFQLLLLKTFVLILIITLVLIFISWRIYGKRISERFMKPATSATIQQLKDSVSKLKLPKEHTPRI